MSRKARGMRTQRVLAEYLIDKFPACYPAGAGESGKDIRRTPGYSIEIKARSRLDIKGGLKQAAANCDEGEAPVLIVRLNGQGEKNVDEWVVIQRLSDWRDTL